jgi:hypothetical protein
VPVIFSMGGCTSMGSRARRRRACRSPCRHLLASFAALPRSLVTRDLAEVSPLWRRAPARIRPITGRPSLALRSHTRTPMGSPHGSLSLDGGVRAYHVPHMLLDGLGPAYSPATVWSAAVVTSLLLPVAHLLVQAYQRLGLALVDDEFSAIHMCWPYHQPNPPTTLTLAVATLPHGSFATFPVRRPCPGGFRPRNCSRRMPR